MEAKLIEPRPVSEERKAQLRAWREKCPDLPVRMFTLQREDPPMICKNERLYAGSRVEWDEGKFHFVADFTFDDISSSETVISHFRYYSNEPPLAHKRNTPWHRPRKLEYKRPETRPKYDTGRGKEVRCKDHMRFIEPMISYNEYLRDLWFMGYRKFEADLLARKYWLGDVRRLAAFKEDEWTFLNVTVRGYARNYFVGSEMLCGLPSDSGSLYFSEVLWDLASILMGQAQDVVRKRITEAQKTLSLLEK